MSYLSDLRREVEFALTTWLGRAGETTGAVLDLAERLAASHFATCHRSSDMREPTLTATGVRVDDGVAAAIRDYADLGLFGAAFESGLGGMGLDPALHAGAFLLFAAANLAASAYPMLTTANARLLATFASDAQVHAFARPQIEGRWLGTMCLSETQAGSNLGDITTRAEPDGEDALGRRYRLFGTKMWISGADHDITENIVHLVLAKAAGPDGRPVSGTAGISLFVCPKVLPDGTRNDAVVTGLNHKLGYRGIPNCVLNLGDGATTPDGAAGAIGWLVGDEGAGLRQMFQMMNEARIGVSLGAAATGYRAFRQALAYAKERVQGRPAGAARNDGRRIEIIDHPDVRRILTRQKALSEGALALALHCASLDPSDERSAALLALLTPVAKSWTSTWSLVVNDLAIQVLGGAGYTRDFDVELLWRDNRLNPIHEGTNGIQAIDLLERKLLRSDGSAFRALREEATRCAWLARHDPELEPLAKLLDEAWSAVDRALGSLQAMEEKARLAWASPFLDALGHAVVARLWLEQAMACDSNEFGRGKRQACQAFFALELPMIASWMAPLSNGGRLGAPMRAEDL